MVTIVGTFPLNFLCALAGGPISLIKSYKDIFSPTIIGLWQFWRLFPSPHFLSENKRIISCTVVNLFKKTLVIVGFVTYFVTFFA